MLKITKNKTYNNNYYVITWKNSKHKAIIDKRFFIAYMFDYLDMTFTNKRLTLDYLKVNSTFFENEMNFNVGENTYSMFKWKNANEFYPNINQKLKKDFINFEEYLQSGFSKLTGEQMLSYTSHKHLSLIESIELYKGVEQLKSNANYKSSNKELEK